MKDIEFIPGRLPKDQAWPEVDGVLRSAINRILYVRLLLPRESGKEHSQRKATHEVYGKRIYPSIKN